MSSGVGDRLIKFLGLKSTATQPQSNTCTGSNCQPNDHQNGCPMKPSNSIIEYQLTDDQQNDLSRKASLATRVKTIKELEELVGCQRLVDFTVKSIVFETIDLLDDNYSTDIRHTVYKFYKSLALGQLDKLRDLLPILWSLISDKVTHEEDIPLRMELLIAMTDGGRNYEHIKCKIGPFVNQWFDKTIVCQRISADFLEFITNLIKNNNQYIDQNLMTDLTTKICHLMQRVINTEEMTACYHIMDAIICHSMLPLKMLTIFVIILCKGVNNSYFNSICIKIMRNLLSTHLGHSCVDSLRYILNDETNYGDLFLMRGAINFLSRSLWDQNRIETLRHTPNVILPIFKSSLQCKHQSVAFEVLQSLICLIENQKKILNEQSWDLMLDIADEIVFNYEICCENSGHEFNQVFHKFLDIVEDLNDKKQFYGETDKLFALLEKCSLYRSELSGKRLIQYRAQSLKADKDDWIDSLKHLMDMFYKEEKRIYIRLEALDILSEFVRNYRYIHEEVLYEAIIIPYLSHIESDPSVECRGRAIQLLVDLVNDSNVAKRCVDILDILDRICKRVFECNYVSASNKNSNTSDSDGSDIKTAIRGLISLFKNKLFSIPGLTAIHAFKIIVSHLSVHYTVPDYNPFIGQIGSVVKQEIFDLLLNIRANSKGQIGVFSQRSNPSQPDNTLKYSLFIVCERNELSPSTSSAASPVVSATTTPQTINPLSPPPSPIQHSVNISNLWTLSFNDMFKVLSICLRTEKDWIVLKLVLNALPKFLKNKAIILSGSPNVANDLCNALCYLINETSAKLTELITTDPRLTKADFQSFVYPSLSALVGYQNELEFKNQCHIIKCLQNGLILVSGKPSVLRQNILSLTICAVEMQEAMTKCLPETLLSLSKISATVALSIPKLEFLSNVILLSQLYHNFTMDQYMSVFAIALPYTNPFKFNEYTVALAHRVIAMWFLKCRLPCRKSIVPFIIKGLQTNVLEEINHMNQYNDAQRLRSSSLNTDQSLAHKKLEARLSLQSSPPPLPSTPHSSHSHFSFSFSNEAIFQHNQLSQHLPQQQINNSTICENEFQESKHELVETCMDMLASYTFGMCSTVPFKSPMVEQLLDRSKSETWIVGHKLVTVTTSGCGSRAVSNGLCDKCLQMCRNSDNSEISSNEDIATNNNDVFQQSFESKNKIELTNSIDSDKLVRRRHQSEIGHILRPQSSKPQSSAFDDSCLNHNIQRVNSFTTNKTTLCSCWCQGWAEILVRRSTGVSSWIVRLQNSLGNFPYSSSPPDDLPDLTALLRTNRTREPSIEGSGSQEAIDSKRNSFDINEIENDSVFKRTVSNPQMDEISEKPLISSNNENGSEKPFVFRPIETAPIPSTRTSPSQPVTRTQSFGSKIRSDFKTRLLDRKEFRSNDLESHAEFAPQRGYSHSRETTKTPIVPLRINEAENMSGPRDRVHTISVMSPANINRRFSKDVDTSYSMPKYSGLCPKYVFLQLYYNSMIYERCPEIRVDKDIEVHDKTKPILLPKSDAIDRSLKNLDRITPYETHKIGVLYVGPGQAKDKTAILSNPFGSLRYIKFLRGLGKMIRLEDVDSQVTFLGGLDDKGQDGKYAISWEDNLVQVIFHVATLMPTKTDTDPNFNNKKKHIGNDFVCIVYNESGSSVNISTIKGDGQFIQAIVVITPFEYNSNLVTIQAKEDFLNLIGHFDSQMLSDSALPLFVRQLALHANLGSMVYNVGHSGTSTFQTQHVSNWVQRLKQIKRIRQRSTNKSGNDASHRSLSNDLADDLTSGIGVNPQTGDNLKSQYIFPDFNDYS